MTGLAHDASPYASILIPAHARPRCLDMAVAAACAQSVTDIEVLIVCDGARSEVRAVAEAWASRDARVRAAFHDKGEGAGQRHRDTAIRQARGPRMFYCDDDDLLLPDHVARLGAMLDRVDVAETPVVAGTPSGAIDVGVCALELEPVRRVVASGTVKAIWDTHLAHRTALYRDRVAPFDAETPELPRVLTGLMLAPGVTSERLNAVTALSLIGARRSSWGEDARAAEMAEWARRVAEPGFAERAWAEGRRVMHTAALVAGLGDDAGAVAEASLTATTPRVAEDVLRAARAVIAADTGQRIDQGAAASVLAGLSDSDPGPWPHLSRVDTLVRPYLPPQARIRVARDLPETRWSLAVIADAEARLGGAVSEETEAAMLALPPGEQFGVGVALAATQWQVLKDAEAARRWLDHARVRPCKPQHAGMFDHLAKQVGAEALFADSIMRDVMTPRPWRARR